MILNSLLAKTKNGAYPIKPFNSSYCILNGRRLCGPFWKCGCKDRCQGHSSIFHHEVHFNLAKLLNSRREFICELICKFN